ncbi:MAG: arsenate reductase [Rhodanobacteraceae bacterium]
MTQPTIYGLKNCDTCRRARKWLAAQGIAFRFVDYRDDPVTAATLERWAAAVGGWEALINRRSATWRQLSEVERDARSDAAWLRLAVAHPTLVKRPLLVDGKTIQIGFSEAAWREHLEGSQ